jgi:hypothetical protein
MTQPVSAMLVNGTQINNASDLPIGLSEIKQGTVHGYKFFNHCRVQQSWVDWLSWKPETTYDLCFSKVAVNPGSQIVRPSESSHDIRTDEITIGEIVTPCGKKCTSAISPFRDFEFRPNKSYSGVLDQRIYEACAPGFHFYPSSKILSEHVPLLYEEKTYSGAVGWHYTPKYLDNLFV